MSEVVEKMIEDISSLSSQEKDELLLALFSQKKLEAEELADSISGPTGTAVDDELLSRMEGPFIDVSTEEDRKAVQNEVRRRVNEKLGQDLFEDA